MMNISTNAEWQQRIEDYCEAWTTYDGKPDFKRIGEYYAHDPDVIIYDTLPPLEGFTGFEALRAIYPNLERLVVTPNKDVQVRLLAGGTVAITTHTFRLLIPLKAVQHSKLTPGRATCGRSGTASGSSSTSIPQL